MSIHSRFRTLSALLGVIGVATLATLLGSAATPRFLPDDPIQVERDTEDASGMKQFEPDLFVEFAYNVITGRGSFAPVRAKNVNSVDEVPDSNWFTNRAGSRPITVADVAKGPDTTDGPAAGTWTVTASKSDGVTPGFTIKDSTGQRWFLKFDPPGFRAMATGTEVTVTKLMWALGYNVPENHIAYLQRNQLTVGDGAKFTPAGGTRRAMKRADIDQLLERVNHEPNGSYRVVASKALEGTPIGRIRFDGTRSDDPNDIVEHEHRRELRGYGTFAAWLNHVDAKGINSLDMLVKRDGKSVVQHNLIDFGSALGSGATEAADYWAGSQYLVELGLTGRQITGFGFVRPRGQARDFYEARSIGRLPQDNTRFNPELWKPREPNRAFLQARDDDKFWAAQKLQAISTDMIRAAVRAGDFGDAAAEGFLVRALAERRDAILHAYLPTINPITDPALSVDGVLTFRNAAVDADVARAPREYRASWYRFDNATGRTQHIGQSYGGTTTLMFPADRSLTESDILKVELTAESDHYAAWAGRVDAFFQRTGNGWRLVGFERLPDLVAGPAMTD